MKFTIQVEKIRSYQTLVYKNGHRTFRKKDYIQYLDKAKKQIEVTETFTGYTDINIKFYSTTKRLGDLDNITKPILDLLQEVQIITNDRNVKKLTLEKIFKTKTNYIEIEIKEATWQHGKHYG